MREEVLVAIVMFAISIAGSVATKNDRKWSVLFLLLASVAGSLAAGMGVRFREIVEGPFGFLDSMLCVCCATVFVSALDRSGAFRLLFARFCAIRNRVLKAFAMLFLIALPAMLTGFAGASLLTTGRLVGNGISRQDKRKAVLTVSVGAFLGVILPPNCIPAIIASNGAGSVLPTPYVGFFLPLLVVALPAFIVFALMNTGTFAQVQANEQDKAADREAAGSLIVLALVLVAVLVDGLLSSFVYIGGNTLVFFVATVLTIAVCKGYGSVRNTLDTVSDGLMKAVVPTAVVFALGSFIEVSSMTGVRGYYSLLTISCNVQYLMLVLMAIAIVLGYFVSVPVPAFLITYATFPIGWLANTVTVTGCSIAIAIAALVAFRGGIVESAAKALGLEERPGRAQVLKAVWLPVVLVLAMGIVMVLFGDSLSFLIL